MIKYELYLAGNVADIDEKISVQITKAVDDVSSFATRNTSFSKVIVLPGTATNNALLGHIHELGSANPYTVGQTNIGSVFNVAQTTKAELRLNGLLVLRGVFRLVKIIKNKSQIEYEGALFGDLGGFISAIGNSRLENLDFSAYNHTYNTSNIESSWDTINGYSYFYPLIDYGTYSTAKVDYDIRTLRPALYVKEYLDKMFLAAGYTYTSDFFNTSFFKSLIIPHNQQRLTRLDDLQLEGTIDNLVYPDGDPSKILDISATTLGSFTVVDANTLQYSGSSNLLANIVITLNYDYGDSTGNPVSLNLFINGATAGTVTFGAGVGQTVTLTINNLSIPPSATFEIAITQVTDPIQLLTINSGTFVVQTSVPINVPLNNGDNIIINDTIPRGVFQKDFFASMLKMFNLYVGEDRQNEKNLLIEPYIDYYDLTTDSDWSYKVDISKPFDIAPMGNLNGRFFEYKYKPDNDFYNENYQKKYNQGYGDRLFDTGFQFSKDKQTTELIFAASPLVQYTGTDKVVTAIYKKSKGNSVDQEELTESVIRILIAKKITGITSWVIKDGSTPLASYTKYGYAGHLNDPSSPTVDINFGVPFEIFCTPTSYTSANLFNEYWSAYIAEIADKDSKLLSCYVYLNPLEFSVLDLSIPVFIDGVRWRINKVSDYDATNNELVKVELLKIINNG